MPRAARHHVHLQLDKLTKKVDALRGGQSQRLGWEYLPHQIPVFTNPTKNKVLAKGRRWGGTRGTVRWLLDECLDGDNVRALWVDVGYRQIIRYLKQYFFTALRTLPSGAWKWNSMLSQLEFANGSFIDFGSAERPELLEGAAYDKLVVNEAGIVLRNEELWQNTLLPMTIENDGADIFLNGTPKGLGVYHELFTRGEDPLDKEWASFQRSSFDNPIVNKKLLERVMQQMPEHTQQQEIYAKFIASGGEFFQVVEGAAVGEWYDNPLEGHMYVLGVDLGKAHDFTVIWVGDVVTRRAVHVQRFNRRPWDQTVKYLHEMSKKWNAATLCMDATGLGDVVVDDLLALGLIVEAFVFTMSSKRALFSVLAADLEFGRMVFPYHRETVNELRAFEDRKSKSGSGNYQLGAPPGGFDDCVAALALCNWALSQLSGESDLIAVSGIGSMDYLTDGRPSSLPN